MPQRDCIVKGDYIQVDLGNQQSIGRVRFVVGGGDYDKITKYHLEYVAAGADVTNQDSWKKVNASDYIGTDNGRDYYSVCLIGVQAQYIRLVCDDDDKFTDSNGNVIGYGKAKW